MKNLLRRMLLVFIAIPLLLAIVFYLDFLNMIGFNIIVVLFSGLGAVECTNIFSNKVYKIPGTK